MSTRKYGQAVREFTEAYGLEKSTVSEHFIEASRAKLKRMMERRLDKTRLCALLIDATPFEGQQMVAALGIGEDGRKTILGIRQAQCPCVSDPARRHGPYFEITYKAHGKTVNVKLSPEAAPLYRAAALQYRRLKTLLSRLEKLSQTILRQQAKLEQSQHHD